MLLIVASHAAAVLAGIAVLASEWPLLAAVYFVVCRLAYVGYVGIALKREEAIEDKTGSEDRYGRFKRIANFLMNNDAVGFVALCLSTRWELPASMWILIPTGAALVVLGLGCKIWAAKTLGFSSYFWHDFFAPPDRFESCREGPYRLLRNPMYTIGYAHAYGFALAAGSIYGLAAAVFDHLTIFALYRWVEKPHLLAQRYS